MPRLARLYVRTSLLYLALGSVLGGLLLWNKGLPLAGVIWNLLPAHIALMTWGWLLDLTLGIAYWILPRSGTDRPHAWLAGVAFIFMNGGLLLAALQSWLAAPSLMAAAGLLQFAAALAFAVHAWPRVRPAIQHSRKT